MYLLPSTLPIAHFENTPQDKYRYVLFTFFKIKSLKSQSRSNLIMIMYTDLQGDKKFREIS